MSEKYMPNGGVRRYYRVYICVKRVSKTVVFLVCDNSGCEGIGHLITCIM